MELFRHLREPATPLLGRLYSLLVGTRSRLSLTHSALTQALSVAALFPLSSSNRDGPVVCAESQVGARPEGQVLSLEAFIGFVLVFCMMNEDDLLRCECIALPL